MPPPRPSARGEVKTKEVDPKDTKRAAAFALWMNAKMPMASFFRTLNVTPLVKFSRKNALPFNMLLCHCTGKAASQITEFYMLPVRDLMMAFDRLAVGVTVQCGNGKICTCDVPFSWELRQFHEDYMHFTRQVISSGEPHELEQEAMVIGTYGLPDYSIEGAVTSYSGFRNNPSMLWGRYRKSFWKTTLPVSFQFHHTQMDEAHAAWFLDNLQQAIDGISPGL